MQTEPIVFKGADLYKEEASWAAIGTSLANRSGPVTLGSVGLTGRALTRGAPRKGERKKLYLSNRRDKITN